MMRYFVPAIVRKDFRIRMIRTFDKRQRRPGLVCDIYLELLPRCYIDEAVLSGFCSPFSIGLRLAPLKPIADVDVLKG